VTVRGDIVVVSLQGDYGKPRPALIVQTDVMADHASVVLCPLTSDLHAAHFRVTIPPVPGTGLAVTSQVMADKLVTVPRTKISAPIGAITSAQLRDVERAIAFVVGFGT